MSKRLVSLLLSVLLIVNVAAVTISAAPAPDVVGTSYQEAATIVTGMGFMSLKDGGNFEPAGEITVGEFIAAVLKFANIDASTVNPQPRYTDVPSSHTYAKEVEMAYQMNIYRGLDINNFGVDNKLTMGVAVKAVLNAAGYGAYADAKGGYPIGYINLAMDKKLISRSATEKTALTRGDAAELLYNSLFLYVLRPSYVDGKEYYEEDTANTILSAVHDCYKDEGIVTQNAYVSLPIGSGLPEGNIRVNGSIYTSDKIELDSYLGYNIVVIYSTAKGNREVKAIALNGLKNNVITLDLADVIQITPNKVVYLPDDAKKETKYSHTATLAILNNYAPAQMSDGSNYVIPDCGTITLIDNNNDGEYNVVLMDSQETMIVNSIDKKNQIIYAKYPTGLALDISDFDVCEVYDPTGKAVKFGDIAKGDVAMYTIYPDQKKVVINLVRTTATVKVEELFKRAGSDVYPNKIKFVSDGKVYEVAPVYYNETGLSSIQTGSNYEISLDSKGRVANMVQKGSDSLQFGYLVKGTKLTEGFEKGIEVMIYTTDGKFIKAKSGEKIMYSGDAAGSLQKVSSQRIDSDDVFTYLRSATPSEFDTAFNDGVTIESNKRFGAFAVRYRLDANGGLTALETAYRDKFADGFRAAGTIGSSEMRYKSRGKIIGGPIMMGDDTKVLKVSPANESDTESGYNSKATIVNEEYYSNLYAYSTTLDSAAAQYIIQRDSSAGATLESNDPAYVFVKYVESYNTETGVSGNNVVLFEGGDFVSYPVEDTWVSATSDGIDPNTKKFLIKGHELVPGDIIRPAFNGKGEIAIGTEWMFDVTARATKSGTFGDKIVDGIITFYGTIHRKLGSGAYGRPANTGTVANAILNFDTAKTVVVVDMNEPREAMQFTVGSADDIKTEYEVGAGRATNVFTFIREGALVTTVVYK